MWVQVLIVGLWTTAAAYGSESAVAQICDAPYQEVQVFLNATLIKDTDLTSALTLDNSLNTYLNTNMCSQACPCINGYQNLWGGFSEKQLNSYRRTGVPGRFNSDSNGNVLMVWNGQISNFDECIKRLMQDGYQYTAA